MKGSPQSAGRSPQVKNQQLFPYSFINPSWLPPLFLAMLVVVLFGKFLLPGTNWIVSKGTEDLANQSLWWRQFGFSELRQGHLALWNPHIFCGTPFFGGFQAALLYPPNWLCLFLPLPFAINLGVALHVFLMGWFTYLWIKGRDSRIPSALLAALMLMFGAAYFLRMVPGHLPNLCAMPWIPLILFAVDGWKRERTGRWILLGMAAIALQLFAGHVQYSYYTALFTGVYVILGTILEKRKDSFISGFLLMGVGGGLLSAVQLFTGWDAGRESLRGAGLPLSIANIASMTPERLWCLLVPDFFGGLKDYWGGSFYWEGVIYGSVTAFLLVLFALRAARGPGKKFFGWTALFLTVLAVGTHTPLFSFFHRYVPLFNSFRGVGKVDIFITLCLAALAAMGMDEVLGNLRSLRTLFNMAAWVGAVLAAATLVFGVATLAHSRVFGPYAAHARSMTLNLAISAILAALLALLAHRGGQQPLFRYGILLVAGLELFLFAARNLPFFDYRLALAKAQAIQGIYNMEPGDYRVTAGNANYTLGTSGSDIWGDDPVLPYRYARFVALTQHADPDYDFLQKFDLREFPPSLGLLRLRYVFTPAGDGWSIRRLNLREAPRAYLAEQWEVIPLEGIMGKIADPKVRVGGKVFLESDPGIKYQEEGLFGSTVAVREISSDQLEVSAKLSEPEVLVVTDNYSKGWKVVPLEESDQKAFQVMPANGFQLGVPLPAGNHHFILEYRPSAFVIGKWVSIVSVVLYLFWCWRAFHKPHPMEPAAL